MRFGESADQVHTFILEKCGDAVEQESYLVRTGSIKFDECVRRVNALRWLATAQSADGRWDANQFGGGTESQTLGHDRDAAVTGHVQPLVRVGRP